MSNIVSVLTYKSSDEIILKEGTDAWALNPKHAAKCKYVICVRNRHDVRKIWHGKEKHREAFLVGKIKKVVKSQSMSGRFKIEINEYSKISIQEFWTKGDRNPVSYKEVDIKRIKDLKFKKIEKFKEGKIFKDRKEITQNGLHNNPGFGISQIQGIANAVVLSGGYVDETDDRGEEVVYIGQGGRDQKTGKQTANQSFSNVWNKALQFNCQWNIPVRVFRGSNLNSTYAPKNGYRYDGKYLINDCWYSKGQDGFTICNFKLVRPENFVPNEKTRYSVNQNLKEIFNKPSTMQLTDIDLDKDLKKWKPKGNIDMQKNYQDKLELLEKTTKKHEDTVKIIAKIFKEKKLKSRKAQFDLYVQLNGVGKLFEIKTWKPKNLKEQIRNGIIKLLEYKVRYQNEKIIPQKVDLYLALNSNPMKLMDKYKYLLDLMDNLKITFCWVENKRIKTIKKFTNNISWIN